MVKEKRKEILIQNNNRSMLKKEKEYMLYSKDEFKLLVANDILLKFTLHSAAGLHLFF
jgi:hypothetical protein